MSLAPRAAWLTPAIAGSAVMVQTLSATVILNGLPVMAAAFGVAPVRMNLAITLYLLAVAVCLPFCGWLADRFGARRVFMGAILLFGIASAIAGFSQTFEQLLLARVLQGAAGSGLLPVARLILLRTTARSDLVGALSILAMPALLGPVIGPVLGGAIITFADWRWMFFMDLPVSALGLALVWRYVPEVAEVARRPIDALGAALVGVGLAALILAFEALGRDHPSAWIVIAFALGGAVVFGLFLWHARRAPHPIIDLSIFRLQSYSASVLGGGFQRIAHAAHPFLLVMLLQIGLGHSPFAAGMMIAVAGAAAVLMKSATPPLLRRYGFRNVLVVNGVLVALTIAATALFTAQWPTWAILAILGISGFFRSLEFTAMNALGYAEIDADQMGAATTTISISQQLTQSVGVAMAATLLHLSMSARGAAVVDAKSVAPVLIVVAIISLGSLAWFATLPKSVGHDLHSRDLSQPE